MKRPIRIALAAALSIVVTSVWAQPKMQGMQGMETGKQPAAAAQTIHKASATVKSVDLDAGTVTLAHAPIASLKWPAMTMAFKVGDKRLFDKLAVGRRVEVELVQAGKGYAVKAVD